MADKLSAAEFQAGYGKLLRAFEKQPNEERDQVYYEYLSKLSPEQFNSIIDSAIKEEIKFPPISVLLNIANNRGRHIL